MPFGMRTIGGVDCLELSGSGSRLVGSHPTFILPSIFAVIGILPFVVFRVSQDRHLGISS